MEVQLQELVDKIKKDGIETASAEADRIINEAKTQAASIVKKAKEDADVLVKKGQDEAERLEKAAISAISQAARNVTLSFRDGIVSQVNALIKAETNKTYDSAVLKDLLPTIVKSWISSSHSNDITVFLAPADVQKLETSFKTVLKDEIAKGLEIKADKSLSSGFKIGSKDGAAYYDFSADAVAALFSDYLNPRIAALLQDAVKE